MSYLTNILAQIEAERRRSEPQLTLTMTPEGLAMLLPQSSREMLPQVLRQLSGLGTTIKTDNRKFQVNVDVQHFSPDEISVTTANGYVVIEASHDEKKDEHGWVARKFVRRYPLPEGSNVETVQSRLSSDGVLTVTASLDKPVTNERIVPIIQTGPVKTQPEGFKPEVGGGESIVKIAVENSE